MLRREVLISHLVADSIMELLVVHSMGVISNSSSLSASRLISNPDSMVHRLALSRATDSSNSINSPTARANKATVSRHLLDLTALVVLSSFLLHPLDSIRASTISMASTAGMGRRSSSSKVMGSNNHILLRLSNSRQGIRLTRRIRRKVVLMVRRLRVGSLGTMVVGRRRRSNRIRILGGNEMAIAA